MRYLWIFIPFFLFAQELMLPVVYDPFNKAQKILKKAKEPVLLPKKREIKLRLSAIFNKKAFINGRFYQKGDKIAGYKIIRIKDDYVVLKKKGRIRIITLQEKRVLGIVKND